ncbi:hypothetical protein ABPG77_010174 [Micractinium sp. CCAP 211/92]
MLTKVEEVYKQKGLHKPTGLLSWLQRVACGGLLLLLAGVPQQLVYRSMMRQQLTLEQFVSAIAIAAALLGAAAMTGMGGDLRLCYSAAGLLGAAAPANFVRTIPERVVADGAALQAAQAALMGHVDGAAQLLDQLAAHPTLQGAADDVVADAAEALQFLTVLE